MSSNESLTVESMPVERQQLAEEITNQYTSMKSSRNEAERRWKETTNYVYATSTRETTNDAVGGLDPDNQSGWSHSTHLPKLTQIYDNLIANYRFALFPHNDWFKFIGEDKEAVTIKKRKVAESYLKTKHRLNDFEDTVLALLNDWSLYGNCFAEVTYEERTSDSDGDTYIDYIGPVVRRISPYDIVFNPLAASFASTPKIIRSIQSMGEFIRTVEENPTRNYDQAVVNTVKEIRSTAFLAGSGEEDKSNQLVFDGFGSWSLYIRSGYVELLDFYGDIWDAEKGVLLKNQVITVVDRSFVLRREDIKTRTGKPNIFHASWRDRPDNLWGMGPLDNLIGMQYQINHLENAKADALDQMIAPTRVIVGDVDESGVEIGRPGGEYRILGGEGSVKNLAPDVTILNADFMNQAKMDLMEELAGSPREAMGIRTPGEKTAFEVNSLQNAASRNFQNKISQYESNFVDKLLNAELELGREFLNGEDTIKVVDENFGVEEFMKITKEDLKNNGKIVPIGARHFARQQQLIANATQLIQLATQDPEVLQHFPAKRLAKIYEELLGLDDLELFVEFGRVFEQQELQQLNQSAALAGEQEAENAEVEDVITD